MWGPLLVHVFDRGYASANWLAILGSYRARFVIRWIGKHVFLTLAGEEKKLWEIGRGKKYRAHKEIWELIQALLRFKCHRTGKRCQNTPAPLYRLRWALSRLWDDYRPRLTCFIPPTPDPLALGSLISHLERFQKNWG
jgi:hypothetical protein